METIHADGTPLAAYLESEGTYDPDFDGVDDSERTHSPAELAGSDVHSSFAPHAKKFGLHPRLRTADLPSFRLDSSPRSAINRLHHAWSTAVNSRLGRSDNTKFLEHFRYTLIASQLLNEYLDQGALQPGTVPCGGLDGTSEHWLGLGFSVSAYGAAASAAVVVALASLLHWARSGRSVGMSKSRALIVIAGFLVAALVGYACVRRQWLKYLRHQAVSTASGLTTNWQASELSTGSALSFIQEVELVSKGYKLSTPLPPISRIEDQTGGRRCARLRSRLHKSFAANIQACIDACAAITPLIDIDDLERYYDVYDISLQDAREALGLGALAVLGDDPESLKSLRVLSYRSSILRRITLCSLMALEADGGTPDFYRWRVATTAMANLSQTLATSAEGVGQTLRETETLNTPSTPPNNPASKGPMRERFRGQVRKISMLSSGIRGLQAKMQILREETNRSIEAASDDVVELGPNLLAQYDAIGQDLRELMQAWENGRASLQHSISRRENRRSLASTSSILSPVSSLGGLTAVGETDTESSAGGDMHDTVAAESLLFRRKSNRASLPAQPSPYVSGEESASSTPPTVYEAVARSRHRARSSAGAAALLSREERIARMHDERERQAQMRARREANTSMLRELESVISLRPKKGANAAPAPSTQAAPS